MVSHLFQLEPSSSSQALLQNGNCRNGLTDRQTTWGLTDRGTSPEQTHEQPESSNHDYVPSD